MSISKRINKALLDIQSGDLENAMISISIALDATAKREFNITGNKERIMNLIQRHQAYIYYISTNGWLLTEGNVLLAGKSIGEHIYKSIRCSLLHEASLSDEFFFHDGIGIAGLRIGTNYPAESAGKFIISSAFIVSLALVVISSPSNKNEEPQDLRIKFSNGTIVDLRTDWGNPSVIDIAQGS